MSALLEGFADVMRKAFCLGAVLTSTRSSFAPFMKDAIALF